MGLSSYYRQYDAQNLDTLNQQKEIINQTADASIKMIEDAGNAQIKEAEHAYDGVINTANVQKLINERAVAERMSNMGLTDSGLNRTQQTAIELSRSNAVNNAMVARQKQVDALALAVSQQVGQINIQRNTDIMNADLNYNANRDSWAASMYDADQQAAAARYKAKLEYEADLDANEDVNEAAKAKARDALIAKLDNDDITDEAKAAYIDIYYSQYGEDELLHPHLVSMGFKSPSAEEVNGAVEASYDAKKQEIDAYDYENATNEAGNTRAVKMLIAQMPTYVKNKTEGIEWVRKLFGDGKRGISAEQAAYLLRYVNSHYTE